MKQWIEDRYKLTDFVREAIRKEINMRTGFQIELDECEDRREILNEMLVEEEGRFIELSEKRVLWLQEQNEKNINGTITNGYLYTYKTPEEAARDLVNLIDLPYEELLVRVKRKWKELKGEK